MQKFQSGSKVEYFSASQNKWIQATVQGYDHQKGTYQLDCHPAAPAQKLREIATEKRASGYPTVPPVSAKQQFSVGYAVEYYSASRGGWIPGVVKGYDPKSDTYDLDIQSMAIASKVRARKFPGAPDALAHTVAASQQRPGTDQRVSLAEQERQRAERTRRLAADAEARKKQEAEQVRHQTMIRKTAVMEKTQRQDAERRRLAAEGASAEARAEAERRQREAAEAEAENRRREAREAEDLRREREEAELRRLEEENGGNLMAKEKDEFVTALAALRKRYKDYPDALATCLKTIRAYINNLAGNPHEPKFQRINMNNIAFKTRVARLDGAVAVLISIGFQLEGTNLVVGEEFLKTKGCRFFDAVAKIDVIVDQLKK